MIEQPQDREYMDALAVHMLRYEATHPKPVQPLLERSRLWIKAALGVIVCASLVVSASHTIPTFAGQITGDSRNLVAIAAFVMVEGTLIVGSYLLHRLHVARPALGRTMLIAAVIVAFVIAVAGNLHHRLLESGFATGEVWFWFDLGTSVVVGISPPVLALISMEVLAMMAADDERRRARALETYQTQLDAWTEGMRRSWDSQKRRYVEMSVVREEAGQTARPLSALSARTDGQDSERTHGFASGYNRTANARDAVRAHLDANEEDRRLSARALAEKVGVGKTVAAEVLKEFKSQ